MVTAPAGAHMNGAEPRNHSRSGFPRWVAPRLLRFDAKRNAVVEGTPRTSQGLSVALLFFWPPGKRSLLRSLDTGPAAGSVLRPPQSWRSPLPVVPGRRKPCDSSLLSAHPPLQIAER